MKKLLPIFSLLLIFSLITACSDDDDGKDEIDFIRVSPTSIPAAFDQTVLTVDVDASGSWTAKSNVGWCAVEPTGQGDGKVTLTLQTNMSSEQRPKTATITFTRGTAETTLSVKQAGMPLNTDILPYIEDAGLKAFFSPSGTGFTLEQALATTKIDLYGNNVFISSAKGLELFSNLDSLTITDCEKLTEIDPSPFKKMKYLNLTGNSLTDIDISELTELEELHCGNNKISELTIARASLTKLYCQGNNMSSLELPDFTYIRELDCSDNNLTELNLSESISLSVINCENNKFTKLDISNNTNLTSFDADPNENLLQIKVWDGFTPGLSFSIPATAKYVEKFE